MVIGPLIKLWTNVVKNEPSCAKIRPKLGVKTALSAGVVYCSAEKLGIFGKSGLMKYITQKIVVTKNWQKSGLI